tara:strand:+ start:163 stop:588 length:426 start_codon:yes stop_codon:yes gene_type:complete
MSTADSLGFWDLPEPEKDKNAEKEWLPIPKVAVTIPFGYKQSEEDKAILLPIIEELNALEKAKLHLRQYSYREVSMWLTKTTGRYISHIGLNKRINNERKRKKQAEAKRQWAKRYKEAIEAAEKLETQRVGAYREQAAAAS